MKYAENLFARRDPPRPLRDATNASAQPSSLPVAAATLPAAVRPAAPLPASAPDTMISRTEEPGGSKLIVGPNIKLKGVEIDDCDTLVVEGRVEATMVSRAIQIAENGAFIGKVDVDMAEIRGEIGRASCRERV